MSPESLAVQVAYGAALIYLGLVALIVPRDRGLFVLAPHLPWLGLFGLVRGTHELASSLASPFFFEHALLPLAGMPHSVILLLSALPLLEFARRAVGETRMLHGAGRALTGPAIYPLAALAVGVAALALGEAAFAIREAAHLGLILPGTIVAGVALHDALERTPEFPDSRAFRVFVLVLAGALMVFGLSSGMLGWLSNPAADWMPLQDTGIAVAGVPVVLVLAMSAAIAAIALTLIVSRLWTATNRHRQQAVAELRARDAQLETLLAERTRDLREEIDRRREAQAHAVALVGRLATAQRVAAMGSWQLEVRTGKLEWSDEVYRIYELDRRRFGASYDAFLNLLHPEDRERVAGLYADSLARRRPYESLHRIVMPDGRIKWLQTHCDTEFGADGEPLLSTGTVQDVTRRIELERERESLRHKLELSNVELEREVLARTQQLESERAFVSTLLDVLGALVIVIDEEGRIVRFNHACERITGYRFDEVRGRHFRMLLDRGQRPIVHDERAGLQPPGSPKLYESEWRTRAGERRLIAWSNATVRDDAGNEYVIGAGIDVTEQRRTERELRHTLVELEVAKSAAEQASAAKTEFIAHMSHELRTPLNAVLGFAQLLEFEPLSDEARIDVQQILQSGSHLLSLINDLLDLSRIEAGHLDIDGTSIDCDGLIDECLASIQTEAAARDIVLERHGHRGLGVRADRRRFKQVLLNLLSNAIKYNREGGRVSLSVEPLARGRVRIAISDTGVGIAPHERRALFEPFNRLGQERTGVEGTGIGLALCKRLVELMGGAIDVDSAPGRGSTFRVDLPQAASERAATPGRLPAAGPAASGAIATGTVLYVEDNPASALLIRNLLRSRPEVRLITSPSGREALALLETHRPGLILLDIDLPDIDGYQVLSRLRRIPSVAASTVVAVTANAIAGEAERALKAGFDRYLTKPLDLGAILCLIDEELAAAPSACLASVEDTATLSGSAGQELP